ncbi:uncharacterized protein FOMMEDRAFT_116484 [Fomitiporia mediterranea MF3/22]|uniref:uncharacterized protein n=1 Tax=Fomitiporia mediterranea (strain MF3/22) TaxID=694068 RepID=UPI000440903D|nr:uncharacterized protein FOMMEDRAFT_116484 [Fomitiporia mediterranea MF3/22]EJD08043.1 hypothetical protein FOMMEDRAFT_116484 [Fomitiporia mediterranea MF3/22]
MDARKLYKFLCKGYALAPPFVSVITVFINAPFGRFTLPNDSWLIFDGLKSWIIMEIVCPITFIIGLKRAPLAQGTSTPPLSLSLEDPRTLLSLLFLIHYANRALISPLRSPPRSKMHIIVPMAAFFFQVINGSLMGSYFSSPEAYSFLNASNSMSRSGSPAALGRKSFWIGAGIWIVGWAGNILHDEILMNIRRDALKKKSDGDKKSKPTSTKPHYGIPQGYLYRYISYPNYFCEWVEWAGFAVAAAPIPSLSYEGFTTAAPPWLFFVSLVLLMGTRAYKGHLWYLEKFPEYPKERKAMVPFIL